MNQNARIELGMRKLEHPRGGMNTPNNVSNILVKNYHSNSRKNAKKATRLRPMTTHRCQPSPINIGHGGSSPHRDQAPPRGVIGRSYKLSYGRGSPKGVLVGPTILSRGVRRGFYLHWAARFFSKGVSQRYEDNEHKTVLEHTFTGEDYNFYWLLAILSVLNLFLCLIGAKWYVYKEKRLVEEGLELEKIEPSCHA
ncbi:hypothetical protein HYC85_004599 [Camellia sinensis]|uniref:Uncharacterized protein n=1 Tax=Camellia sinensis TaxID=4442 RepID=A0A7J7HZ17_CAMSI|nr:hypothetical protein HYC85_004599 [Camellia sinensis]